MITAPAPFSGSDQVLLFSSRDDLPPARQSYLG